MAKRKNNTGRVVAEKWMFGGICRETKERFAVIVADRTSATLIKAIEMYIEKGTHIISDGWAAYRQLADHPDYLFNWVNHKENFVDPMNDQIHTQTIERMWRPFKDQNRKRHGTHRTMIDSYICEGLWRWNLKKDDDAFLHILHDIKEFWPPGHEKNSLPFFD